MCVCVCTLHPTNLNIVEASHKDPVGTTSCNMPWWQHPIVFIYTRHVFIVTGAFLAVKLRLRIYHMFFR